MVRTGRAGASRRLLVGLMVLALLASCGGDRVATGRFALDTVAGSPARSKTPSPLARGSLSKGRYFTSRFEPHLRVTLPSGWSLLSEDRSLIVLRRDADHLGITLARKSKIFVPANKSFVTGTVQSSLRGATPLHGSVVDLVRRLPDVVTETGPPVRLLGVNATSTLVRPPAGQVPGDCIASAPCTAVFVMDPSDEVFVLDAGVEHQYVELPDRDIEVEVTRLLINSRDSLNDAAAVLASLRTAGR